MKNQRSETEGTYPIVKEKMIETFGEQNIQIKLKTFNNASTQFISNNIISELSKEDADLIILEPFILL
ncbi:hypothetical protein [Neobacillus sp. 114]|uniref:hypothetical protein n=1 Tax=Neobacillus sp. 114 TaxID=3048535 RepID=UPI0024C2B9C8|nr:hypothetical protein [Neobacillus sp. 114]